MNIQKKSGGLLLIMLLLAELSVAAPFVREASFQRVFDGHDYYGDGRNFAIDLGTMSSNGKVVAFYGNTYFSSTNHYKLFIHNFEAATAPVEVALPPSVGLFNRNAGMISNADGSRIFFVADDASDTTGGDFHLCMLNGLTGEVTILLTATPLNIEIPQDIATDANGDYLYFNETDNGDRGDLWRIQTSGGAVPERVIQAGSVGHPSGGVGRFIDQFDLSDDGKTIAFFIEGRIKSDNSSVRTDKELFVKTDSGIRFLTNNDQNSKGDLVISGDGSTIVYSGSPAGTWDWQVTSPDAAVESQIHIEAGYRNCGDRPGITTDGSTIFARSTMNGVSACNAYLVKSDGSSRLMVEPDQISMLSTGENEGLHLSGDGSRVFFKNRDYTPSNPSDDWYNLTSGVFGENLWASQVPSITSVAYPAPLFADLQDRTQSFETRIGVSDAQGAATIDNVGENTLFPSGYEDRGGAGPIDFGYAIDKIPNMNNLYTATGFDGSSWPAMNPVTVRFSVEDQDGNVGYADTVIQVAAAGCSTDSVETLEPADMPGSNDVSCFADSRIDTAGHVVVKSGIVLYLSSPVVVLNGGFSVLAGGTVIVE